MADIDAVPWGSPSLLRARESLVKMELIPSVDVAADMALRESEQRFRATFEQAAVGIAHVAPDGSWLRVNQRLCDIVGYTLQELLERTFQDITYPEDLEPDLIQARRLVAGEIETYSIEKRYIRKDGSLVWVDLTGSAVRNDKGAVDYFIAVVEDISERKQTEQALKKNEERFRIAAETGGDLTFEWDPATNRYTALYGDLVRLLGMECGESLIRFEDYLSFVHPDDVHILDEFIAGIERSDLPRYEAEYRLVRRDGEIIYVLGRVTVERDAGGQITRIIGVVANITERKRVELERRATAEENARLLQVAAEAAVQQRAFLRDVLYSVTEGKLRLCDTPNDLPDPLEPEGGAIALTRPTLKGLRSKVHEVAVARGLSDERWFDLVSAVGECAMNAIQHGGDVAAARICAGPGIVQVWVEDRGTGINIADIPKATLLRGHSGGASFGHGFYMMLQTVDTIYLLTNPNGTTIVLEQSATPPEPAWLQTAVDNLGS